MGFFRMTFFSFLGFAGESQFPLGCLVQGLGLMMFWVSSSPLQKAQSQLDLYCSRKSATFISWMCSGMMARMRQWLYLILALASSFKLGAGRGTQRGGRGSVLPFPTGISRNWSSTLGKSGVFRSYGGEFELTNIITLAHCLNGMISSKVVWQICLIEQISQINNFQIQRSLMQNSGHLGAEISSLEQLPVKKRTKTDVFCTITLAFYVVLLALILIFVHNQDNLDKITYPTDNNGTLCGYDSPEYPYVYYASYTDPTKRLCVSKCPSESDERLSCKPTDTLGCARNSNPKYEVVIYDSYLDEGRIGLFCLPKDEYIRQYVLKMSNTANKYHILSVMDAFWQGSWISLTLGILFFLLIHFQPYKVVPWVIAVGCVFSFCLAAFILTLSGYLLAKMLLSVFFCLIGSFSLVTLCNQYRRDSLVVCARLLHAAALTHGNQQEYKKLNFNLSNLSSLVKPLAVIASFFALYALWFYIHLRQVLSVWSVGKLVFQKDKPFYTVQGFSSNFLMLLVGVQLIWGVFFLREAFNFITGSHAAYWYYSKDGEPSFVDRTKMMLQYHLGSIAGASWLQGLLYFPDLIMDFFSSSDEPEERPPLNSTFRTKPYNTPIGNQRYFDEDTGICREFFSLVRGESLFCVALTGQNYCQAARHCQFLSSNSRFYDYSQITNRLFRINLHIVPVFIVLVISGIKMGASATPYAIIIIAFLCFFIVTFFLSYHPEKMEGLLIATYLDESIENGQLKRAPKIIELTYQEDVQYSQVNKSMGMLLCEEQEFAINERE